MTQARGREASIDDFYIVALPVVRVFVGPAEGGEPHPSPVPSLVHLLRRRRVRGLRPAGPVVILVVGSIVRVATRCIDAPTSSSDPSSPRSSLPPGRDDHRFLPLGGRGVEEVAIFDTKFVVVVRTSGPNRAFVAVVVLHALSRQNGVVNVRVPLYPPFPPPLSAPQY